ncbi:hypothetical protein [Priestia megaterium]|uniref:hypothetical protein n=1 Tax=Priestia megaterium TaxID=1404 RepID=UPI002795CAC7|nr:hypothetical protein [Priestia megaterium]
MNIKNFDDYPKSLKKALRYIKQDASLSQLRNLERQLAKSIEIRKKALEKGNIN